MPAQPENYRVLPSTVATHDVVICGAGPVGLTLSLLLSRFGIDHLVVDKRTTFNDTPRARGISHRTAEIWDELDLTPELEQLTLPAKWLRQMTYVETLAGDLVGAVEIQDGLPGAASRITPNDAYCISQGQDGCVAQAARPRAEKAVASVRHRTDRP